MTAVTGLWIIPGDLRIGPLRGELQGLMVCRGRLGRDLIGVSGVLLSVALGPSQVWAQLDAEQAQKLAEADIQASQAQPSGSFGGELGLGKLGEDFFLTVNLRLSYDQPTWGVGVQAPLRLRIWDRDPNNDQDYGGVLRREDWDQPSDYLRILRYVYVGQADKKGPYYVRIGELTALTVGHGTIMHRYFNGIDANKWRTGINAVGNVGPYSGEVVLGDIVDPYLFGMRFTMRPLEVFLEKDNPWASRLVMGHSLFTDVRAPIGLARDANGAILTNADGVPEVTRERALMIVGLLDIGYELLDTELLSITPYMDLNKMTQVPNGLGWHLGVLSSLRLPLGIDTLSASLRTEYRFVSGDYVGPYFNVVYEIERYQHLERGGGTVRPKLLELCVGDPLCNSPVAAARHGYFFEGQVGLPKFVVAGFEYLDYAGPRDDGQFRLSVDVPALEFLQLSAYYYRVNVAGPSDLFKVDDKSAIVAQARVPVWGPLVLQLRWWRIWRSCGADGTICEDGTEGYRSVDDWSVGAGFNFTF